MKMAMKVKVAVELEMDVHFQREAAISTFVNAEHSPKSAHQKPLPHPPMLSAPHLRRSAADITVFYDDHEGAWGEQRIRWHLKRTYKRPRASPISWSNSSVGFADLS